MPLNVIHQGNETTIEDGATALIGSDAEASIRIVRPGISRRHAIVSFDGSEWKIQDAGSRNGTFKDGDRIQALSIDGPTTLYLGHPTEGEALSLVPLAKGGDATKVDPAPPAPVAKTEKKAAVPEPSPEIARPAPRVATPQPSGTQTVSDVELAQLTAAIRDQISAVKGLTWSVWAMIAVTAVLIVLTLFVGILSN